MILVVSFFFKQKTAYELRISDWSSDVCSSDLEQSRHHARSRNVRAQVSRSPAPSGSPLPRPGLGGGAAAPRAGALLLVEQGGELLHHGAAELLGVDDGDGAAIVAGHVMADADRHQLDRRAVLDVADHVAQVLLEVVAGIHRERRIVDRGAIRSEEHTSELQSLMRSSYAVF